MPFDDTTRNQLQKFVGDARAALTVEFTRQLQNEYGMDPASGRVTPLESLGHLDDARRETARILRETLGHYRAAAPGSEVKDLLERIVREQAFTVLNRLAALRMAEARGLLIESVGNGYTSKGFQLYARVAGTGLGEMGDAYRAYLFSLCDEFALDLSVLFDRYSPTGRLFPRETALLQLLALINAPQIAPLWAEDETIGWIYQYFNTKEERKQMREASSSPRNSRELAVRNQFFTPRYVVEFLTDNTLGRTWYEMTQGITALKDTCRYLVRRPDEVFLESWPDAEPLVEQLMTGDESNFPEFEIRTEEGRHRLFAFSSTVHAYKRHPLDETPLWYISHMDRVRQESSLLEYSTQELLDLMWFVARDARYVEGPIPLEYYRSLLPLGNEVRRRVLASRAEGLSQEELLKQPVFVPHRPVKDPREIRMLDPACGSMHFALYAFDLFYTIYEEAWDIPYLNFAPLENAALLPLRETYADDRDAFIRDVPRLIIEHNIHGIDIDPRAVQIAGLSLWLRAQRSWHEQGIKPANRPVIRRANIVCAEPMPGEHDLLDGFIDKHLSNTPELRLLGQLVRRVFDAMKLAGEAGSLLKIEDEIADDIAEAKRKWQEGAKPVQGRLFAAEAYEPDQLQFGLDVSGITDDAFWEQAEERIYIALRQYAGEAEASNYQRRLFTDDASRGFAFIDLCRKYYDIILMNPPFGDVPSKSRSLLDKLYPAGSNDIYAAFVLRGSDFLAKEAFLGALTSRAFLAGRNHIAFRTLLLEGSPGIEQRLSIFLDLGWGVLDDALVETGGLIMGPRSKSDDLVFVDQRRETFVDSWQSIRREDVFFRSQAFFSDMPMRQLLYWLSDNEKGKLKTQTPFEPEVGRVTTGLTTADDFRFVRLAWEVTISELGTGWVPFLKGGEYCWLISEHHLVINWKQSGEELAAFNAHIGGNVARSRQSSHLYFKPGVTWSRRSSKGLSIRRVRRGCIFSDKSPVIVPDKPQDLHWILPLLISEEYHRLIEGQVTGASYEPSVVKVLPTPPATVIDILTSVNDIFRSVDVATSINETSPWFVPRLIPSVRIDLWKKALADLRILLKRAGLDISSAAEKKQIRTIEEQEAQFSPEQDRQSVYLGMVLGRWNIKSLISNCLSEEQPGSFEAAPICSPGMLQNAAGFPAEPSDVPDDYPLRISWHGILVDDPGHPEDVERRVQETLAVIWQDRTDAIEQEACDILGIKALRDYFRRPAAFFADHLQRYSKSRRQAPIYWPLSTTSGSYTLWLYYHRLTDQTLYACVNDFVEPKLRDVAGAANGLRAKAGSRTRAEEQDLENLETFERELTAFRDELLRLAPLWKPNLNDGVQITAAPLWRLFRLPKWQKTLKETWEKLERGDYDWAHLAYSLWPDRVRQKCKTDKSLAIAHDLEDLYVEPPASTKKKRGRKTVITEEMEMDEE